MKHRGGFDYKANVRAKQNHKENHDETKRQAQDICKWF